MHYAIPCSRRFFVAMHLEEAASGRFCKYCIKGYIRNPLSLPAHNKKAALQLIRRVFTHLIQASSYSYIDYLVKMRKELPCFY